MPVRSPRAAFVVAYILTSSNAVLGGLLAAAFLFLGAALILVGRFVVPQETVIEARARTRDPEQERAVAQVVRSVGEGVTRRRLLVTAGADGRCRARRRRRHRRSLAGAVDRGRGGAVAVPGGDEASGRARASGAGFRS